MHYISPVLSIGLTGGIGSGKTTIANIFRQYNVELIDTDVIAHKISSSKGIAIPLISATFGDKFITSHGALDRNRMRAYIFNHYPAKIKLEKILHPLIWQEAIRMTKNITSAYVIYIVPLLTELREWRQYVNRILVIDCTEEAQITRVMQRSRMPYKQVQAIIATQNTRSARLLIADDIIENNSEKTALPPQIEKLHKYYLTIVKNNYTKIF